MPVLDPIPTPAYTATTSRNADTFNPAGHLYNDPQGLRGTAKNSSIGDASLLNTYYLKKVLTEAAKQRKFGKLASVENMPKHMGQRMSAWHFLPLLDDRNLNDQGIDARGVQIRNGNLYGSSKDIGTITSNLPVLSETGGRVNRVGFQRRQIEGTFNKFGFFYEWSQDFVDFDSDPSVLGKMYSEAIIGAEKINEDMLQIDLLHGAGIVIYAGAATSDATMDDTCIVNYSTLQRLGRALDANNTPKSTKIIKGSTMVDTKTLTTSRIAFIGSDVKAMLENMKNQFGAPALIPVHQYAAATTTMEDEIGAIGEFRFIHVEEMKHWAGAGATEDPTKGILATDGKYDIFPILVIGSESFTTIGFQTSNTGANSVKFSILTKAPGKDTASHNDPYGEIGFTSIKWYYGIMFLRPERIGLIKTVAPY